MNLMTSQAVALVSALAFGAILLTAWILGHAATWPRRLTAALSLLVASALVASSVMCLSNKTMGWVRNTTDLWHVLTADSGAGQDVVKIASAKSIQNEGHRGGAPAPGEKKAAAAVTPSAITTPRATASPSPTPQPSPTASPTPAVPPQQVEWHHDPGSTQWRAHIIGATSGIDSVMTVWAPADWSPRDGKIYDVVIFLHGYPGSDQGPIQSLNIDTTFPSLAQEGAIRPSLFVIPNISIGNTQPDCVDVDGRPKVESFVVNDVVNAIKSNFPNVNRDPSGWLLSGISSGGYCAPVLALRHPNEFYGAIAMGGYDTPQLGVLSHADAAIRSQMTISHMVAAATDHPVNLFIAASPNDADSVRLARDVQAITKPGDDIAVDASIKGGHSWVTWSEQLPLGLRWWGAGEQRLRDANRGAADKLATLNADESAVTIATTAPTASATPTATPSAPTAPSMVPLDPNASVTHAGLFSLKGLGSIAIADALALLTSIGVLILGPRLRVRDRALASRHAAHGRGSLAGRLGFLTARVGLVFLAAAVVSAAVGITYNRSGEFFASWSDLAENWSALF